MTNTFFARQLATYAGYHRDPRNRATHFIGIPAIVFSLLVPLALPPLNKPLQDWILLFAMLPFNGLRPFLSLATLVAMTAVFGWIALDAGIGLAMIVVILPMLIIAQWIANNFGATVAWTVFAVFFVGGWALQLIGHVWEGRRPALVDNLFQAFVGPMFIMAEVLFALGLKQDLKAVVETVTPSTNELTARQSSRQ